MQLGMEHSNSEKKLIQAWQQAMLCTASPDQPTIKSRETDIHKRCKYYLIVTLLKLHQGYC